MEQSSRDHAARIYQDPNDAHCRRAGCHCTHSDDCYRGWIDIKQDGREYALPCRTCRPAQRRVTQEAPDRRAMQERLQARSMGQQWTGGGGQVPYATLDDNFAEHPKVFSLSDAAFRLHTSGIIYCSRHTTDGNVAGEKVRTLVPKYRASALRELVDRGMWIPILGGAAYHIHDYLEWNLSRAQIEARREARSKSGRKGASKRWDAA